jgi:hypothetical protein
VLATVITILSVTELVNDKPETFGEIASEKVLLPVPLLAVTVSVMDIPAVVFKVRNEAVREIAGLTTIVTTRIDVALRESVTVIVSEKVLSVVELVAVKPLPKIKYPMFAVEVSIDTWLFTPDKERVRVPVPNAAVNAPEVSDFPAVVVRVIAPLADPA